MTISDLYSPFYETGEKVLQSRTSNDACPTKIMELK